MVRDKECLRRFVAQHILFHVLPFMLADIGGIADDDVPKAGNPALWTESPECPDTGNSRRPLNALHSPGRWQELAG